MMYNNSTYENENIQKYDLTQKIDRILYLDIARTLAIFLVVLCHATEGIYKMSLEEWSVLSIQSKIFRTSLFTLGRLGVPLFLFISGKLVLSKKIENTEDCLNFYKKNLIPLLLATEIWIVIYNIFNSIYYLKPIDFNMLLQNMLFLNKVIFPNMWYMPMIIGIYLALPFVSIIVKKIDYKVIKIPMIIAFLILVLLPNINDITKTVFNQQFKTQVDVSFLGGIYGLYILLGYYIGNGGLKKINGVYFIIIGIISFVLTCCYQYWKFEIGKAYNVWYDYIGIYIISICLFELLSRIKNNLNKYIKDFVMYISKASLGIFFVHVIIQNILTKLIPFKNINNSVAAPVLTILVFTISITIIAILSKIKFIKNRVFLIK